LVLVTGSSGRIGQAVVAELTRQQIPARGFDRVPTAGLSDMAVGELQDPASLARAMTGVETLIHLAATPDDDDFLRELVPNNVIGVYHALETARQAGVRRLILASSGQVVWHRRGTGPWPVRVDDPPTPRAWYAACKLFLEGAGRAMVEGHGLSVIAVRLGWCPRTKGQVEEIAGCDWAQDVYLSPSDAGRFFACAVRASADIRWAVVYATSKPCHIHRYDLEPARVLLGYEPRDVWPQGIEVVT
jgi:nucleoside-diphosphate-sugar epimerase